MILQLQHITKSIGVREILSGISFGVGAGEKVALVGVNGAGKTSVFRVITGEWDADTGDVARKNGMRTAYLPQTAEGAQSEISGTLQEYLATAHAPFAEMEREMQRLEAEMAGNAAPAVLSRYDTLQNQYATEGGYQQDSRLRGVLRGLGFPEAMWAQNFATLSGGEKTRAMLGKLLLTPSDLLLLDEPTNHLDITSVTWLEDYIRQFPGAAIIISHDRYFMDKTCTKTVEIEHRKSITYSGNYSYFVQKKAAERALYEKHFNQQQKEIKHHEAVIKTIRGFQTEAAIIRAKSREKLLAKIERMDAPTRDPAHMRLRLTPRIKSGGDVLFAEDIAMSFGAPLFTGVNLELRRGERIALIGPNGIGKTTLLKILINELSPTHGRIRHGVNVQTGYYDQAHTFSEASLRKSVFQEIADTYPQMPQTEIRTTLAAFMFIGDDVFKPISALSGGERGRVQLAKIMLMGANLLVLDEPTNHLDLDSKEVLEYALTNYSGTLIYISHDRYFINNTATRVLELSPHGLAAYDGNYDFYLEKKTAAKNTPTDAPPPDDNGQKSASYKEKKAAEAAIRKHAAAIARVEAEITATEQAISEKQALLATDEIGRNAEEAARIFAEKTGLDEHLQILYDKWEELQQEGANA
jgi:ATP-binding cassette subfamily F protein 3